MIHEIDAETGAVIEAWNALVDVAHGHGTGVKGDDKDLTVGGGLTEAIGGGWAMRTPDDRIASFDHDVAGTPVMTDADNIWSAAGQRAAVDAQYYGWLTDRWLQDESKVGGFDLVGECTVATPEGALRYGSQLKFIVHYSNSYANAAFNPSDGTFIFGDGNSQTTAFSGGQDVVSHEMVHRLTECRAPLNYYSQAGALNEAISDILATAMEWDFNEATSSNCRLASGQTMCPDWFLGEDVMTGTGASFAFRNLQNPTRGHWADRYTGTSDNAGVHHNSTIPTQAFYLMVNGGRNARCSGPNDPKADCDILVPAISLADATQIMFDGWGALTYQADFCEAHDATLFEAEQWSAEHAATVELAWSAVGRGEDDCNPPVGLSVTPASLTMKPTGSGTVTVNSTDLTVVPPSPLTATPSPVSGGTSVLIAANGASDGIYQVSISTATETKYVGVAVDGTAPSVGVSSVDLATSGSVSSTGVVPLRVTWSASDAASGLANAALKAGSTTFANGPGGTTAVITGNQSITFQVTATDTAGNQAVPAQSGPWAIGRFQEGSAVYARVWSALAGSQTWDTTRYSTKSRASAKFTFTGTDVAWISTRGTNRGKAKVILDGVLVKTVDLKASSLQVRQIVFAATGLSAGQHTLKVVVLATSGRPRVDINGIVVLNH